jgi:GNAT superfamily N-acetyltransferase
MAVSIEIKRREELPEEDCRFIEEWINEIFAEDRQSIQWAEREWHLILRVDGEFVSHVNLVRREGLVGDQTVILGGIGDVITLPRWRRKGYAHQLLREAHRFMEEELGVEYGLLISDPDNANFYTQLGWQAINERLWFDQPSGRSSIPPIPGAVMVLPLGGRVWPEGEIDLCGLPW